MALNRSHVRKGKAAHHFRREVSKTHPKNVKARPMRGGFRL